MSALGMYAGKPLGKPRREMNHNFITGCRESAFESADIWEYRIDFKSRFFIENLAFTICVLLARD